MTATRLLSTFTASGVLVLGSFISVSAQVIPDNTTPTTVDVNGNINGGSAAGTNLFHSFQEFSIPDGGRAFFNNNLDIVNIFSRVTGGNISDINGLLGANGTANLFLINPNGIIFGENARLDIGGSFFGSTADSILFPDGEFSAIDPDNPPLITINAPLGLGIRDNPADITVNGNGNGVRLFDSGVIDTQDALRVGTESTFGLVGGRLIFSDATIKTAGGRIELGSVAGGQVGLTPVDNGFTVDYSNINNFRDISLSGTSVIDASGLGGGDIQVTGNNISLTGISGFVNATLGANSGGDIDIFAADSIDISGVENENNFVSGISTRIFPQGTGDGGNINIETGTLSIGDRAFIGTSAFGQGGNAGDININASESVSLESQGNTSAIASNLNTGATGSGGDINITTPSLTVANGAFLNASTGGQGSAGNVTVTAPNSISLFGRDTTLGNTGVFTSSGTTGSAGNISFTTGSLTLNNGAALVALNSAEGNAGNVTINATEGVSLANNSSIFVTGANGGSINIDAKNLQLTAGSSLFSGSNTSPQSADIQTGDVTINLQEDIVLDGANGENLTIITNNNNGNGSGDAGNLRINARNMTFRNGGNIFYVSGGEADIGDITLTATGDISFDGTKDVSRSGISNFVLQGAEGNVGKIDITAQNLSVTNGAVIQSQVAGNANSGDINLNVPGTIRVDGFGELIFSDGTTSILASQISSQVSGSGVGDSGNINITDTQNLILSRNGNISADVFGIGNGGDIDINADVINIGQQGNTALRSSKISSEILNNSNPSITQADVNKITGGNIKINTNSLSINDGGDISAGINGIGNGGNITVNSTDKIFVNGTPSISAIRADVQGNSFGNAGDLTINTNQLSVTNGAYISTSILKGSTGTAGDLTITATDSVDLLNNSSITSSIDEGAIGQGGNVTIQTGDLTATGGSQIGATTSGEGNGGSLTVLATGNIELIGTSEFGRSGLFANAIIGSGDGGDINVFTGNLILRDGAIVSASNFQSVGLSQPGTGNSGDVNITADNIVAFPNQNNDIVANARQGDGGNINITAETVLGLEERPSQPPNQTNDLDVSSEFNLNGNISIEAPNLMSLETGEQLSTEVVTTQVKTSDSCSVDEQGNTTNTLVVKGKGGIPPEPTEPLMADRILGGETPPTQEVSQKPEEVREFTRNPRFYKISEVRENGVNYASYRLDYGDMGTPLDEIVPARGVIVHEDGTFTLTPYPTDNQGNRIPENPGNCS